MAIVFYYSEPQITDDPVRCGTLSCWPACSV